MLPGYAHPSVTYTEHRMFTCRTCGIARSSIYVTYAPIVSAHPTAQPSTNVRNQCTWPDRWTYLYIFVYCYVITIVFVPFHCYIPRFFALVCIVSVTTEAYMRNTALHRFSPRLRCLTEQNTLPANVSFAYYSVTGLCFLSLLFTNDVYFI
jgi:hypothetical protein